MFRNKRKDSAIRTLVAETLVLAKTHGYVEKIEHELEEELQRENKGPPNRIFAKWRHKGEKLLKNKYTLLTVAFFCVTECALILGELILDLHKVKDVLEAQEDATSTFVEGLHKIYPIQVPSTDIQISKLFDRILTSTIQWNSPFSIPGNQSQSSLQNYNESRHRRSMDFSDNIHSKMLYVTSYSGSSVLYDDASNITSRSNMTSPLHGADVDEGSRSATFESIALYGTSHGTSVGHSLEEEIAHALHMASITILSILMFQTILKALCAGTAFFQRKLETFDLCVVLISFVVDLVCMQIMPRYKIQDFVFILAFLLPWRVIRVVNSLVVAVQDHEHFRLKLIYGRKKKIVNSLRESEVKLQLFRAQCNALKRLCYNEGIEEAKVDQILMVEECVVTKAGKSKCKVKIDNSSVIVLNDKSDFPRLSPRPSILNLFDYGSRRKSMQPTSLSSNDRELFLKTSSKDSSKKSFSFLRTRTRSNSESGRGTLSSPDESVIRQQSSFGESALSGLNTPVLIDRKSSLNSPIIANHVRNILSSLDGSVPTENGPCRYGRGSLDEGKKVGSRESDRRGSGLTDIVVPENEIFSSGNSACGYKGSGTITYGGGKCGSDDIGSCGDSRANGINNMGNGSDGNKNGTNTATEALSALKNRRGSLQPQKRVDEDDDYNHFLHVPPYITTVSIHKESGSYGTNCPSPIGEFPTTPAAEDVKLVDIDAPGINTINNVLLPTTTTTPVAPLTTSTTSPTTTIAEIEAFMSNKAIETTPPLATVTVTTTPISHQPNVQPRTNFQPNSMSSSCENPSTIVHCINELDNKTNNSDNTLPVELLNITHKDKTQPSDPSRFRPKTFRTPSDVENENNLTTANETTSFSTITTTTAGNGAPHKGDGMTITSGKSLGNTRHSSITEENETQEPEKEDEIIV